MNTYQALRTSLDTLKCYGDRQMNFHFYKVFQYKFSLFKINNVILKYMERMVSNDFQSSKFLSFNIFLTSQQAASLPIRGE